MIKPNVAKIIVTFINISKMEIITYIFCLEDIMKKKITLLALSMTMLFGLTACGDKEDKDTDKTTVETTEEAVNITDSLEILTTVWGTYGADEMFAIMGGDYNNMVMMHQGLLM